MLHIGVGRLRRVRSPFNSDTFTPASLFASGEQGFILDATLADLSTLFQDSAGATPVTAVEQPVGRINSAVNSHVFSQPTSGAHRPTLSARYNLLLATATLSTQNVTTVAINYTLRFTGAGSITLSGTATGTYNAGTHTITCTSGTLTLTVSGTVTDADFRPANDGVGLPAYQRVTTATDYDTTGFPLYLRFDGTDDFLVSAANINFSGTAQLSQFVAVRNFSAAAAAIITEHSADSNSNNGTFVLAMPRSGSVNAPNSISRGTILTASSSTSTAYAPPVSVVLRSIHNISGDNAEIFVNGASLAASSNDQGTGNFTSQLTYIGRRGGSTIPFNGRIYFPLVCLGRLPTTNEASSMDAYINARNKVY